MVDVEYCEKLFCALLPVMSDYSKARLRRYGTSSGRNKAANRWYGRHIAIFCKAIECNDVHESPLMQSLYGMRFEPKDFGKKFVGRSEMIPGLPI